MTDAGRNTAAFVHCFAFLLMLLPHTGSRSQQNLLTLTDTVKSNSLQPPVYYFEDTSCQLTINQIVQMNSGRFLEMNSSVVSLGRNGSCIWLQFVIKNRSTGTKITDWYLEIESPLDRVSLYIPHPDGSYRVKRSGKWVPQGKRDLQHRNTVFLLPVYPMSRASGTPHLQTYYLQFCNSPFLHFPFSLHSSKGFLQNEKRENGVWGVFFGVTGFLFFFNCIMFLFLKDRLYLYYLLFIFMIGMFQLSNAGYLHSFLPALLPAVVNYCIPVSLCLTCFLFLHFTFEALQLKKHYPVTYRALALASFACLAPLIFLFFHSYSTALFVAVLLVPVTGLTALVLPVLPGNRKRKQLRIIFLLSWGPFLLSGTAISLQRLGMTCFHFVPDSVLNVVFIAGGGVFTFFQGYSMIQLKRRHTAAIHEADRLRDFIDKVDISSRYDERISIAREIHDTVGYALTTVLSQVRAAETQIDPVSVAALERLDRVERVIQYAMDDVRNEVTVLREESNKHKQIDYRLQQLAYFFSRSTEVQINTIISPDIQIDSPTAETIYRITQESLTNAYRHGRASCINVTLKKEPTGKQVRLQISDDGKGFPQDFEEGAGIAGMRERVKNLEGIMELSNETNGGVSVTVLLPFPEEAEGRKNENSKNSSL